MFHCLLVGKTFAPTFGPGNPLKPVIPTFPTSPYKKKSGQRQININCNTHSKWISLLHSLCVCFLCCNTFFINKLRGETCKTTNIYENTPSTELFPPLLPHLIDFTTTRTCSRLRSGSTAAPDHFQTARLRRTVGGLMSALRVRPVSSRVGDAVFTANRQLPPDSSALGPQTLTEKLKLTEMCKGIWPKGLSLLFFLKHQRRKEEEG